MKIKTLLIITAIAVFTLITITVILVIVSRKTPTVTTQEEANAYLQEHSEAQPNLDSPSSYIDVGDYTIVDKSTYIADDEMKEEAVIVPKVPTEFDFTNEGEYLEQRILESTLASYYTDLSCLTITNIHAIEYGYAFDMDINGQAQCEVICTDPHDFTIWPKEN